MSSEIRTVGKHSLIYGAGIVVGKIASFVMLPVYTRYLTPSDYGVLELLSMMIDVVGIIAGMGIVAGLYKFYAAAPTEGDRAEVMSTAAIATCVFSAVGALVGAAFAAPLSRLLLGPAGDPIYIRLFFASYFLQSLQYVPLAMLRATDRSALFVSVNIGRLIGMLSLNILFVVHLRMGVLGVMLAGLTTEFIVTLGLCVLLLRSVGVRFSAARCRQLLDFGRPMIIWSLGSFVTVFSDRFFLNHYASTAHVGIYSLAYKFAFVLSALAYSPFETVWDPRRFEIAKRDDAEAIFARVFVYLNVVLGLTAAGVALFVHDFLWFMSDPAFRPAAYIVPLLLAAQIVFCWTAFCNLGVFLSGQSRQMGRTAGWTTVATIAANFALIPWLGVWGAALATFVTYIFRFALVYSASQRAHRIAYAWGPVARLYAIIATAVLLRMLATKLSPVGSLALSVVLFGATVVAVFMGVLAARDRAMARDLWRRLWAQLASRSIAPAAGRGDGPNG